MFLEVRVPLPAAAASPLKISAQSYDLRSSLPPQIAVEGVSGKISDNSLQAVGNDFAEIGLGADHLPTIGDNDGQLNLEFPPSGLEPEYAGPEVTGGADIRGDDSAGNNNRFENKSVFSSLNETAAKITAQAKHSDNKATKLRNIGNERFDGAGIEPPTDIVEGRRDGGWNSLPSQAPIVRVTYAVFPSVKTELGFSRKNDVLVSLLEQAMQGAYGGYVVLVTRSDAQQKTEMDHFPVAVLARVRSSPLSEMDAELPDPWYVAVEAIREVKISGYNKDVDGNMLARILYPGRKPGNPENETSLMHAAQRLTRQMFRGNMGDLFFDPYRTERVIQMEDPAQVANHLSTNMKLPPEKQEELLAAPSTEARLSILTKKLESLVSIFEKKENRGEEDDELAVLKAKIEAANLPPEAKKLASKEMKHLAALPPMSLERGHLERHLDLLASLPWNKRTEDRFDLKKAREIMERDHYGLEEPKERIIEYLALLEKAGSLRVRTLCFSGPPGVGKTSMGKAIAEAMGRKFVKISVGGVADESLIRGYDSNYKNPKLGRILEAVLKSGVKNPVIQLDEIDKISKEGHNGNAAAALLEALDHEQNHSFEDHYLGVPFDLSEVLFITTANDPNKIDPPLLNRQEILDFQAYTASEKVQIAEDYIIPKYLEKYRYQPEDIRFDSSALNRIVEEYAREAGVRKLEESIQKIIGVIAKWAKEGVESGPFHIQAKDVERYLGLPTFNAEDMAPNGVGVATGLAVQDHGGSLLNIEVSVFNGSGQIQLQDEMERGFRDSARNAKDAIRNIEGKLGLQDTVFQTTDMHIVITPATTVDGPSAGITMATAIASALTKRPVKKGIAMTGELTPLTVRAMEIGGLEQKILAAYSRGYHTVLYPAGNESDIENLAQEVRDAKAEGKFQLIAVKSLDEVLNLALEPATQEPIIPQKRIGFQAPPKSK